MNDSMGRSLRRLDVEHDVRIRPEAEAEALLDLPGNGVGFLQRKMPVHTDVCLDGYVVADAARIKVVRTAHAGVFGE